MTNLEQILIRNKTCVRRDGSEVILMKAVINSPMAV